VWEYIRAVRRTLVVVWRRIRDRFLPPRPHIPESALSYAPFEHQRDSDWIEGWLFLDEAGFGFVARVTSETLFYIRYSYLMRFNYNRIHHALPSSHNQRTRRARDPCFLRFHIRDPDASVRSLDFRGELESIQALTRDMERLAYGEME
jgi:hypothetical protein